MLLIFVLSLPGHNTLVILMSGETRKPILDFFYIPILFYLIICWIVMLLVFKKKKPSRNKVNENANFGSTPHGMAMVLR